MKKSDNNQDELQEFLWEIQKFRESGQMAFLKVEKRDNKCFYGLTKCGHMTSLINEIDFANLDNVFQTIYDRLMVWLGKSISFVYNLNGPEYFIEIEDNIVVILKGNSHEDKEWVLNRIAEDKRKEKRRIKQTMI